MTHFDSGNPVSPLKIRKKYYDTTNTNLLIKEGLSKKYLNFSKFE